MTQTHHNTSAPDARLRLDKWLWAARFFKTRALAVEAIEKHRVRVNGAHTKPAREVRIGDTTVSLKPQFLIDGLSAVHSEYVRISFTKTDNPNKPGPVLITSQSSKDQPGTDNYRYLLQPNLLLR